MTTNVQNLTEAGFPLQLRYVEGANYPFILTAAGISIVGFNDRDLAARTLQDAHYLRIQTDHNGTSVLQDGDEIGSSNYAPFVAVEEALQNLATSGRQWDYQAITFTPEDIGDEEFDEYHEDTPGDIYDGATGLGIVTPRGRWDVNETEALALITGLSSMLNGHLTRPWSHDDPSTILSRGTRTEA